jgi:phage shock protein PspC (stress-responsive transcriptional regulator)
VSELLTSRRCPYCAEEVRSEAVKCRWCGSYLAGSPLQRSWYRVQDGKRVAGVCAGLALEFGISVTLLRLAFVLATIIGGPGIVIYLVLWAVMPWRPAGGAPPGEPPGWVDTGPRSA